MRLRKLALRSQLIVRIFIPIRRDALLIPSPALLVLGPRYVFVCGRDAMAVVTVVGGIGRCEVLVVVGCGEVGLGAAHSF